MLHKYARKRPASSQATHVRMSVHKSKCMSVHMSMRMSIYMSIHMCSFTERPACGQAQVHDGVQPSRCSEQHTPPSLAHTTSPYKPVELGHIHAHAIHFYIRLHAHMHACMHTSYIYTFVYMPTLHTWILLGRHAATTVQCSLRRGRCHRVVGQQEVDARNFATTKPPATTLQTVAILWQQAMGHQST